MKANLVSVIGLALALVLGGCTTIVQVDPTKEGKAAEGVNLAPVTQISAGPQLAARTDRVANIGTLVFSTGKVFAQVFPAAADARGRMELISASCEEMTTESWLIGKTNLIYSVSVSLDLDGRRHVLTARGTGSTHHSYPDAMRAAVEKAASDLASQVRALL